MSVVVAELHTIEGCGVVAVVVVVVVVIVSSSHNMKAAISSPLWVFSQHVFVSLTHPPSHAMRTEHTRMRGPDYFNRGKYANPLAGLTTLNETHGTQFSA